MPSEFDEELSSRLLAFQRQHGLSGDGWAGAETWRKLVEVAYGGSANAQPAPQPDASASGSRSATPGEAHENAEPAVAGGAAANLQGFGVLGQLAGAKPALPPKGVPSAQGMAPEIENFGRIAGDGFMKAFRAIRATGPVSVGGQAIGRGAYGVAEAGSLALEAATAEIAEGALVVAGETLGEVAVVAGGTLAVPAAVEFGLAVIGGIVVGTTFYFVVEGLARKPAPQKPSEEYRGTSLPGGGAPPPAVAPGAAPPVPARAPGTSADPASTPGANPPMPARSPGASDEPVEAPGVVDDPDVCLKLNKASMKHDHHIFPQKFRDLFWLIGIRIHEYTITMGWLEHIGPDGLHVAMDWNGEWEDFFADAPDLQGLTDAAKLELRQRAINKAHQLMLDAGIDQEKVHPYRQKPKKAAPAPLKASHRKR